MNALVAVDSDGCVFDNMTSKHRQAFGPCFHRHYASDCAPERVRRLWEHVNLFSAQRGINFRPERMLMIGDAPGDETAARAARCWFHPIVPGQEADSWEVCQRDILPLLLGEHEERLGAALDDQLQRFHRILA
ncbi:MAG: hypothetical protein ACOCXJ_09605 [Planctomycetota bacterium]